MKNIVIVGHSSHGKTALTTSLETMNCNVTVIEPESTASEDMAKEKGINLVNNKMPILKLTNPYEGLQQHYEPHQYNNRKGRRLKNKKKFNKL